MLPTLDSARDEILGLFNVKWAADTPAINEGVAIPIEWQGVDSGSPPDPNAPFCRVTVNHATGQQSTFGAVGERRFTRSGVVTVQIFAPLSAGGGLSFAVKAAIIARNAYEGIGTDSGIWFRNARIQEIGPSETWHQINVVTDFFYDELR